VRKLTLPVRTERLILREFVKSDFDAVFAYSSDPKVTRYLFFGPRDADATAEYLEELLASQIEQPRIRFELAVEETTSGRVIGACDLSLIEANVVDLGYMLGTPDWGKGYATEISLALLEAAFRELRAERVISTVDVNNGASIRVLEKIGMRCFASTAAPRIAGGTATCSSCRGKSGKTNGADQRCLSAASLVSCSRSRLAARFNVSASGMPLRALLRRVSRPPIKTAITKAMMRMVLSIRRKSGSSPLERRWPPSVHRARTSCRV
jgi:ribosomal-protein-alanine N-acetyltransferase